MHFKRLEIHGFKSFAEPCKLEFYDGLTGIVGPNGCGKSNIVEAIRWVMGENSARRMRSSEMADVIFNGTEKRAKRNFAEISLVLDNQAFNAPEKYNIHDELVITRRIDRGEGSAYSINGNGVRASDVQLLFADLSLGAGGSAQISQGMVGDIIYQRASDRRKLLEEAAGIRGLRVRREMAERKVAKTEENLTRIEDVIKLLQEQNQELEVASKQARLYKDISADIQTLQSKRYYLQYQTHMKVLNHQKQQFVKAEADIITANVEKTVLTDEFVEYQQKLTSTQEKFYEQQARHKRFELELETFDAQSQARQDTLLKVKTRQVDIAEQLKTLQIRCDNAQEKKQILAQEVVELKKQNDNPQAEIATFTAEYQKLQAEYQELQTNLSKRNEERADAQAVHNALCKEKEEMEARQKRYHDSQNTYQEEMAQLTEALKSFDQNNQSNTQLSQSHVTLKQVQEKTDMLLQQTLPEAEADFTSARVNMDKISHDVQQKLRPMQEKQTQISAEIDTLSRVFQKQNHDFTIILDRIEVAEGFETALSAVLADDLDAALETDAPIYWEKSTSSEALKTLPEGVRCMNEFVKAPEALAMRLSQIGVIFDDNDAESLAKKISQGQRLVNQKGAVWRWDGFRISEGAVAPSATRLAERNRLASLVTERGTLEETLSVEKRMLEKQQEEAKQTLYNAEQKLQNLQQENRSAMEQLQQAQQELRQAESNEQQQQNRHQQLQTQQQQLQEKIQENADEKKQVESGIADLTTRIARLAQQDDMVNIINQLARDAQELDMTLRSKHSMIEQLKTALQSKEKQLNDLQNRMEEWGEHEQSAQKDMSHLQSERQELEKQMEQTHLTPKAEEQNRQKILNLIASEAKEIEETQAKLSHLSQDNLSYQQKIDMFHQKIKKAEEIKIRADEGQKIHQAQLQEIIEKIQEEFGTMPEKLLEIGKFSAQEKLPSTDVLTEKLRQKQEEREAMGAVNLRAEAEQQELQARLQEITFQSEDLQQAVTELKRGITHLNQEARKQLLVAFDAVNGHFGKIFTKLFNGGKAMIQWDNEDDPLHAGLEILASPPGKKLHHLGLLSGGEQALTALSLVMAIFMTKPMPLCVLDEVDAPLDDENVRRLYDLIEELSLQMQTRFILVTHHRMGMSRCQYLYGVTMAEKGVSRLVSVDLAEATAA